MKNYHEPSNLISLEKIEKLTQAFLDSWDEKTASPDVKWTKDNPSEGQCTVTALIINELFGGDILDDNQNNHMWNLLPDHTQQDFSRMQFKQEVQLNPDSKKSKIYLLTSKKSISYNTPHRYQILRNRMETIIKELKRNNRNSLD